MVETKGQRVERLRMCAREELKAMIKIVRQLQRPMFGIEDVRAGLLELADAAMDLTEAEWSSDREDAPLAEHMRLDNDEPVIDSDHLPCPDTLPPPRAGAR